MHDWLAHRVRATPGKEALVNAESGNAWSYATLDETVEEMAGRLRALGVEADDHLAAVLGTGVEEVCLIHAAMRVGTTLVPLSPEFTPPELSERFERADIDHVVCDAGTEATVRDAAEAIDPWLSVFSIDETDWSDATPIAEAEPTTFTPADWEREDVQLLLFTSGTTGTAKAVQLTMGNLLASATASAFRLGIDPEDRWLVPLSLHHMGGIAPVLRSTLYGTTAIVRSSFDPGGTVDDLRKYEATCVSLVPTMLRRMLDARGTLPDCLRFVLVGGAPCPEELIDRCRDFSVPVCPTYGMTETASQVATARHREAYETPGSVGRPLLWTDVTVVDETGSAVGPGETGELVVSGPTVTPGYYDDHAATGEAIGPHGLHTGDVGYQDEAGRLYVLNRLDDRILTGGENVDPGEVVDALREHADVTDAAVVGLPDKEWGERVAALVVTDAEDLHAADLEPFLRERLAGFKLPRTIGFTGELPRTVSGTVEREAVRERLTDGETESIEPTGTSARAATDTESVRAAVREEEPDEAEPPEANGEETEASDVSEEGPDEAAAPAATEPEADHGTGGDTPAIETEPAAAGELEPPEEPTDGEGDSSATSARSILDAGENGDTERESAETIAELAESAEGGDEPGPADSPGEPSEPVGRAALDEGESAGDDEGEAGEEETDEEAANDGEAEADDGGLRSLVENDREEVSGGEGLRGLAERATAAARGDARKGGSALSEADASDRSGVVDSGPGAALGTGRGTDEEPAGDSEPTAADDGDDTDSSGGSADVDEPESDDPAETDEPADGDDPAETDEQTDANGE